MSRRSVAKHQGSRAEARRPSVVSSTECPPSSSARTAPLRWLRPTRTKPAGRSGSLWGAVLLLFRSKPACGREADPRGHDGRRIGAGVPCYDALTEAVGETVGLVHSLEQRVRDHLPRRAGGDDRLTQVKPRGLDRVGALDGRVVGVLRVLCGVTGKTRSARLSRDILRRGTRESSLRFDLPLP